MNDALLNAALKLAAARPWEDVTMADLAQGAGLSLADLRAHAEDKGDIVKALFARIDRDMLAATNFEGERHDRLFDLYMARFDALNAHRAAFVSILSAFHLQPGEALRALPGLCNSMRWLAEGAGLLTTGWRSEMQTLALSYVYLNGLRAWRNDGSADLSATMAVVDKELRRVAGFLS